MFILDVSYIAPIEKVDPLMEAHLRWVEAGYERGWFLASGRKTPRTGGIIFATGERNAIEAFLAEDPFVAGGVASYVVTEVMVTRVAESLERLKG